MNLPGRYDLLHRRSRLRFRRRRPPPGASPGSLIAHPDATPPEIQAIAYSAEGVVERQVGSAQDVRDLVGSQPVLWVNVDGLGDPQTLEEIAGVFGAHRLALEDAVNLGQRAKVDRYENLLFVVVRVPFPDVHGTEQISLLIGNGFLLTMQEQAGDVFGPVRERLRAGVGKVRTSGADYLAYALIDAVVDSYFPVLERFGDELDALEDDVFGAPDHDTLARLHGLKRDLVNLRKAIWPHREMLATLDREAGDLIAQETRHYLRDAYDHVVRIIDLAEALREVATDLMNTYLTMVSNRMNEVMKVLTIVATVFIPLSFIAGVYGMNFNPSASRWNMPELGWAFGYPAVLLLMLLVGGGMLFFIWRRRWL